MRKFLISATLMASTLAIAAPAAAAQLTVSVGTQYGGQYGQYGGQYGQYGGQYGQYGGQYGNGYGYGYNNGYGQVRSLMVRVNRIEQQIRHLDRRNILSRREASRLQYQANIIERQIRQLSRNGLNGYEARNIQLRIARLEQNVRYQANDGNRYGYRNDSYGIAYDRDRDGRDDRYEDDRGYNHD